MHATRSSADEGGSAEDNIVEIGVIKVGVVRVSRDVCVDIEMVSTTEEDDDCVGAARETRLVR